MRGLFPASLAPPPPLSSGLKRVPDLPPPLQGATSKMGSMSGNFCLPSDHKLFMFCPHERHAHILPVSISPVKGRPLCGSRSPEYRFLGTDDL